MSRVIVLDLTAPHLRVLEADCHGKRVVVRRMTTLVLAEGVESSAESVLNLIRDALAPYAKSGAEVVGLIGRAGAVLRDLRVPDAPLEELPAIVQFQAMRELSFPVEQAAIDYEVVGPPDADGQRHVLLAALQQDVVERYCAAVSAAGLTPGRLGLRPYATWRAYRQVAAMPAGAVLVVSLAGESIELTVARGETVLFSRATMLKTSGDAKRAADPAAAFVAEVSRTLAAFANQVPGVAVERVALAAGPDQHQAASDALAKALAIPVDRFDPFQAAELSGDRTEDPAAFIAAIGAALGVTEPWPIDFLHPKKPVVPRDLRKPLALAAAAAAVVLIGGSYLIAHLNIATGKRTIAGLIKMQADLQKSVKEGNEVVRKSQEAQRWLNSGVDCLDELQRITEDHPDTREMFTTSLKITHDTSPNGTTRIDLGALAKDAGVIGPFHQKLNQGDRYSAQPAIGSVGAGSDRKSGEYKTSVNSQIVVRPTQVEGSASAESGAPPDGAGAAKSNSAATREANLLQVGKKSGDTNAKPAANKK